MSFLIIGAGPAGMLVSKNLLQSFKNNINIFMIEKKILYGGLLWYGVAPDHIDIKSTLKNYTDIF